jgi:hypothetical protein
VSKERPLTLVHVPYGDAYQASAPTIRGLTVRDVQAMVGTQASLQKRRDDMDSWYESLPLGTIVHYNHGFGQFIRAEVVMAVDEGSLSSDGKRKKMLKPIALVGPWKPYDLQPTSYYVKKVREGTPFRTNWTNNYEAPAYSGVYKAHGNPRTLPVAYEPKAGDYRSRSR